MHTHLDLKEDFAWLGAGALLTAYALLSLNIIQESYLFHALNAVGALGLGLITYLKKVYQPAIVNAIWFVIAIVGIITL